MTTPRIRSILGGRLAGCPAAFLILLAVAAFPARAREEIGTANLQERVGKAIAGASLPGGDSKWLRVTKSVGEFKYDTGWALLRCEAANAMTNADFIAAADAIRDSFLKAFQSDGSHSTASEAKTGRRGAAPDDSMYYRATFTDDLGGKGVLSFSVLLVPSGGKSFSILLEYNQVAK